MFYFILSQFEQCWAQKRTQVLAKTAKNQIFVPKFSISNNNNKKYLAHYHWQDWLLTTDYFFFLACPLPEVEPGSTLWSPQSASLCRTSWHAYYCLKTPVKPLWHLKTQRRPPLHLLSSCNHTLPSVILFPPSLPPHQRCSAGATAQRLVEGRAAQLQLLQVTVRYPDVGRQRQTLVQVLCMHKYRNTMKKKRKNRDARRCCKSLQRSRKALVNSVSSG